MYREVSDVSRFQVPCVTKVPDSPLEIITRLPTDNSMSSLFSTSIKISKNALWIIEVMSEFEAHGRNPVTLWKGQKTLSSLLAHRSLTLPGFCIADSQLAECRGPPEVEGAPLFSLTEESFKACHLTLTLDDYLFIAFVGFVVSIASVATNFLLGITANCCHRWSKASEEEEI